jgi:hypothetical protein
MHGKMVLRREFVLANYAELKKANPALPILVREAAGTEAKLIARYGASPAHMEAHGIWGGGSETSRTGSPRDGEGVPQRPGHAPKYAHPHRLPRRCFARPTLHKSPPQHIPVPADFGVEKAVSIQNDPATAVLTKLQELVKHGEKLPRRVALSVAGCGRRGASWGGTAGRREALPATGSRVWHWGR